MRARAGDPPRTMPQKVLAGRSAETSTEDDLVQVKVDQVVLTRAPARAIAEAQLLGLKKTPVEVAVAYDGVCVSDAATCALRAACDDSTVPPETSAHGILVARPGVGFAAPVHLERFASPARLAVTDDPRLCFVGGIGMLSFVVTPGQLAQALVTGSVWLRPPRSVQVLLSGRLRPFVCARDVSLELLRRGLADSIRRIDVATGAPVVIEFAGPSARLLSVAERAVLCAIAPVAGAASALFVSDEKAEAFLRDQRRSKAHRSLSPDAGAPCDDVLSLDLSTVDPLVMDTKGEIKSVRDLAGTPVHQVILGGDSGATLRDMLAAAALLKSKRVPAKLDLLVAPSSRQVLEVLANAGALVDLVATGARLLEPDARIISGELYPTSPGTTSLRTYDPEPLPSGIAPFVVASAETLAYTVATGEIGDPRSFKRPVRVTVPRVFPTEDVLIVRARKADSNATKKERTAESLTCTPWNAEATLTIKTSLPIGKGKAADALVLRDADAPRRLAVSAAALAGTVRAIIAPFIPADIVSVLTGLGIAVFRAESDAIDVLAVASQVVIPKPASWPDSGEVKVAAGASTVTLHWLGRKAEKRWLVAGTSRSSGKGKG